MPVPYLAGALRGWTQKTTVTLITQDVVDYETTEVENDIELDLNIQPMPAVKVMQKPEEDRVWKWWSIIVRQGKLLNIDDIIVVGGIRYRIKVFSNWNQAGWNSGFTKYEAIEDYQ